MTLWGTYSMTLPINCAWLYQRVRFIVFFFSYMQYYVSFGGENYVDLGLGNHRVKCRVHEGFR